MTEDAVGETVAYLSSSEAQDSLARDPYWPKWDSPWWRMTLLWELGLERLLPKAAVSAMSQALRGRYLPFFPPADAELPPGADPRRDVTCHCAVGTMHQVLSACGVDVDAELPWMIPWLLRYQLADGGLNCDARAYRGSRKSSLVSTVPALEAVLGAALRRGASAAEELFLENGARYLLAHKLFRSTSGRVIDPAWLSPCFPRFYDYDLLRGLCFLTRWADWSKRRLPREAFTEAAVLLESAFGEGPVSSRAPACLAERSEIPQSQGWTIGPARGFPLLRECAAPGPKEPLSSAWAETRRRLRAIG